MWDLFNRQKWQIAALLLMCAMVFTALGVQAQTGDATLTSGQAVTGAFNQNTVAQVYVFDGVAGNIVELNAQNDDSLALALLLTDADGGLIAQARDVSAVGETRLSTILPTDGRYYVTLLPVIGVESSLVGRYELLLTIQEGTAPTSSVVATVTPTDEATDEPAVEPTDEVVDPTEEAVETEASAQPQQLLTTSGIQVSLTWDGTADMDLEVRDPVGGALYFLNTSVPSGGVMGPNINGGCEVLSSGTNTETATWSPGGVPVGSYEILVYYQQGCEDSSPVDFTVNATVDGEELAPVAGLLLPGQVFIASFEIDIVDGEAEVAMRDRFGVRGEEVLPDSAAAIIRSAQPITLDSVVTGRITNDMPYQSYSFVAEANQVVSAAVFATSDSLDTYLAILDPTGNVIYSNDDADAGLTDSALNNSLLVVPGSYTIMVSRYGLSIGGTEGDFELNFFSPVSGVDAPVGTVDGTGTTTASSLSALGLDLPTGTIEVSLIWNSRADMRLLLRDPSGDSVYTDNRTPRSGGQMTNLGNLGCAVQEPATTPVSHIYYPSNIQPRAGGYEIDIWYQNDCDDPTPISFTLYISVNGQLISTQSLTTAQPFLQGDHYVTSFFINADGSAVAGEGGLTGLQSIPWQDQVANATPINRGELVNNSIAPDNKFDLFSFDGTSGQTVSIAMTAAAGTNLDTKLYLIGPSGTLATWNDDIVSGTNTNSLINNFTLPSDGQYIIIATHYGDQFGITSGPYTLTLN